MNKKTKNFIISFMGVIYILLGIIAYYRGIENFGLQGILWFSYTVTLIIGIGLITRKAWLVASQFAILLIPYILWNIDFFHVLLTSQSLWGITDYFFTERTSLAQLITLQHLFAIPVTLIGVYLIKLKRKDFWKFSFLEVAIFFIIIKLFTDPEKNINCIFTSCFPLHVPQNVYPVFWLLTYMIMIYLSSLVLRAKMFHE